MKKQLRLINVSVRISLVSLFILAAWALAQRSDTALGRTSNTPATQTQVVLNEKALEANYQFLYDYNVNTTHGFSNTVSSIPNSIVLNEETLEANNRFLYDYNVNTTHGFSDSTSLAADRQYRLALDVSGDDSGCLDIQDPVSLRDCLTAVYHARLVNDYTLGRLR